MSFNTTRFYMKPWTDSYAAKERNTLRVMQNQLKLLQGLYNVQNEFCYYG